MTYLTFLNDRRSVRDFDPNYSISDQEIAEMITHAANAPSSNNFQPWKIVAVTNKAKQAQLMNFAYGQKQVQDASVVFLILGDKKRYNIDKIMTFNVEHAIITAEERPYKTKRVHEYLRLHPEDAGIQGLKFDLGLFSMNLMHVVRAFGYDSVPMRGVDFDKINAYLSLSDDYDAMLLLPVGKALKPGHPHVRYPLASFFTHIKS